jgi:hypothetical protein
MAVELNRTAYDYAQARLSAGKVIYDERDAWSEHQPSTQQENDFIREHGYGEYAKWHLGIDDAEAEDYQAEVQVPLRRFRKGTPRRDINRREQGRTVQTPGHPECGGASARDDRNLTQDAESGIVTLVSGANRRFPVYASDRSGSFQVFVLQYPQGRQPAHHVPAKRRQRLTRKLSSWPCGPPKEMKTSQRRSSS